MALGSALSETLQSKNKASQSLSIEIGKVYSAPFHLFHVQTYRSFWVVVKLWVRSKPTSGLEMKTWKWWWWWLETEVDSWWRELNYPCFASIWSYWRDWLFFMWLCLWGGIIFRIPPRLSSRHRRGITLVVRPCNFLLRLQYQYPSNSCSTPVQYLLRWLLWLKYFPSHLSVCWKLMVGLRWKHEV